MRIIDNTYTGVNPDASRFEMASGAAFASRATVRGGSPRIAQK